MNNPDSNERRIFLKSAAVALVALPVTALFGSPDVIAKSKAEDGHAHGYVNNASDAEHKKYQKGQHCDDCVFWQGADSGWGDCRHPSFSSVQVKAEGWCSQWTNG